MANKASKRLSVAKNQVLYPPPSERAQQIGTAAELIKKGVVKAEWLPGYPGNHPNTQYVLWIYGEGFKPVAASTATVDRLEVPYLRITIHSTEGVEKFEVNRNECGVLVANERERLKAERIRQAQQKITRTTPLVVSMVHTKKGESPQVEFIKSLIRTKEPDKSSDYSMLNEFLKMSASRTGTRLKLPA